MGIGVFGRFMAARLSSQALIYLGRFDQLFEHGDSLEPLMYGDAIAANRLALAGRREEARAQVRRTMSERGIGPDEDWTEALALEALLSAAVLSEEANAAQVLVQ